MMTYTAHLSCGGCKAVLTFTDERPGWKTYDFRVEQADECERSAQFVTEFADLTWERYVIPPDEAMARWRVMGYPRFVRSSKRENLGEVLVERPGFELAIPDSYRYVDCPVCDAHIKEPSRA